MRVPPEPRLCGVDEAGRGPLAGAVYAAAVILDPVQPIDGLADSKALSPARREALAEAIRARSLAWAIASASAAEVDSLNILQATLVAMARAIDALAIAPSEVWVDGNQRPRTTLPCRAIVKGDALVPAISAASILAKTARDAQMLAMDARFPGYGFARHKGYPTRDHLDAIARLGPSPIHRRSFAPVRNAIAARVSVAQAPCATLGNPGKPT
jgi:ribonuclease HII